MPIPYDELAALYAGAREEISSLERVVRAQQTRIMILLERVERLTRLWAEARSLYIRYGGGPHHGS